MPVKCCLYNEVDSQFIRHHCYNVIGFVAKLKGYLLGDMTWIPGWLTLQMNNHSEIWKLLPLAQVVLCLEIASGLSRRREMVSCKLSFTSKSHKTRHPFYSLFLLPPLFKNFMSHWYLWRLGFPWGDWWFPLKCCMCNEVDWQFIRHQWCNGVGCQAPRVLGDMTSIQKLV